MTTLIAILLVAVVVLTVMAYRRATRGDPSSIKGYRNTMEHLRHLSAGAPGPAAAAGPGATVHVRLVPKASPTPRARIFASPGSRRDGTGVGRRTGPDPAPRWSQPEPSADQEPAARPRLIFIDDEALGPAASPESALAHGSPPPPAPLPEPTPAPPAPTHATPPPSVHPALADSPPAAAPPPAPAPAHAAHRRRPGRRIVVAAPLFAVGAVAAVVLLLHPGEVTSAGHSGRSAGASRAPASAPVAHALTRTAASAGTAPAVPPAPSVTPVLTGSSGATYTVTPGPVDLVLTATGRCWVELRSGSASGPIVFEGVLTAGDQRSWTDPGGLWVRLGYPSGVAVQVNGTALHVPTAGPYNITVNSASG